MIELQNITYSVSNRLFLEGAKKKILNNINLTIKQNEILGVVGESGAGKTTLAKIIAGLIKPTDGNIVLNSVTKDKIQILLQNNIELINPYRKIDSLLRDTIDDDLTKHLKTVGLDNFILSKYGYQLSGGERQRIALTRLLATNPKILLLDEPFSAQDFDSQKSLMELFLQLNNELNLTIFCVSHNLHIMSQFPQRLAVMKTGKIVEINKREKIFSNPVNSYTKFLLKAMKFNLTESDFKQY